MLSKIFVGKMLICFSCCLLNHPQVPRSPTADMDDGTSRKIRFGLSQDFVGNRCGVSFSEQDEPNYVGNRVALGPAEVAVWRLAGFIAHMYQEGSDSVGHGRAFAA